MVPVFIEDSAPEEGSVAKVIAMIEEQLRELEAEKRQAAVHEDFNTALQCKRELASWRMREIVWRALGDRGVEQVETVAGLVEELEGRQGADKQVSMQDDRTAAGRARRGGIARRGAVVEAEALQAAGAASVSSFEGRVRLAKMRAGWPAEQLMTLGGTEALLKSTAGLDAEDRPLQRAWQSKYSRNPHHNSSSRDGSLIYYLCVQSSRRRERPL